MIGSTNEIESGASYQPTPPLTLLFNTLFIQSEH